MKCPACSEDRKKKNAKSLGVDHSKNYALCNHCNVSYNLGEVYRREEKKTYKKPPPLTNVTELSDNMVKWFKGRGISQGTLMEMKVGEGDAYIHDAGAEVNCIWFNYIRDGELVSIKYRDGKKRFGLFPGAELIFYNLDSIKESKEAIICEGEIGALTWHEIGHKNVISVPNGAALSKKEKEFYERTGKFTNQTTTNLKYIDNCPEELEEIEKFYIATDTDAPGMKLRQELVRRLGADRCYIIEFGEHKDENDLLMAEGALALEESYKNAREVPIEGVFELEDHWADIEYYYDNGYPKGKTTGIVKLDPHFKWRLGELTILNGYPGSGKSALFLYLAAQASILYGWKWAIYSPESHPVSLLWSQIIEIYIGKTSDKDYESHRMSKEELRAGADWVNEHFFVVDSEETETYDALLKKFKGLVFRKGINGCIIDPWNDLILDMKNGETMETYMRRALSDIRRFKRMHNLHFVIAAHPIAQTSRLKNKDGSDKVPEAADIAGGAMWRNRADNVVTAHRDSDAEIYCETEVHIQKIKFQRLVGIPTIFNPGREPVRIYFDSHTQSFQEEPPERVMDAIANQKSQEEAAAVSYESGDVFKDKKWDEDEFLND